MCHIITQRLKYGGEEGGDWKDRPLRPARKMGGFSERQRKNDYAKQRVRRKRGGKPHGFRKLRFQKMCFENLPGGGKLGRKNRPSTNDGNAHWKNVRRKSLTLRWRIKNGGKRGKNQSSRPM